MYSSVCFVPPNYRIILGETILPVGTQVAQSLGDSYISYAKKKRGYLKEQSVLRDNPVKLVWFNKIYGLIPASLQRLANSSDEANPSNTDSLPYVLTLVAQ